MEDKTCCSYLQHNFHGISKWIHYLLQKLTFPIFSYIKNDFELKKKLEDLSSLPSDMRIFKKDTRAMYTNMSNDHGLEVIKSFWTCIMSNCQTTSLWT